MGEQELSAFADEMVKASSIKGFLGKIPGAVRRGLTSSRVTDTLQSVGQNLNSAVGGGAKELGARVRNPVQGMREGWRSMSPSEAMKMNTPTGSWLRGSLERSGEGVGGKLRRSLVAGEHLREGAETGSGLSGLADRASRAGITGTGGATKYLPIGDRSQFAIGAASTAPALYSAATNEEKDVGKHLGSTAGSLGGWALTSGLPGFVVPWGGQIAAEQLGGRAGAVLDKIRGG